MCALSTKEMFNVLIRTHLTFYHTCLQPFFAQCTCLYMYMKASSVIFISTLQHWRNCLVYLFWIKFNAIMHGTLLSFILHVSWLNISSFNALAGCLSGYMIKRIATFGAKVILDEHCKVVWDNYEAISGCYMSHMVKGKATVETNCAIVDMECVIH